MLRLYHSACRRSGSRVELVGGNQVVTDHFLSVYMQNQLDPFLADLALLSNMDCGTAYKAGVDAVGGVLGAKLKEIGLAVEVYADAVYGDSLLARWRGRGTARVLLLGHLDTVYPQGWCGKHPFALEGDKAHGPGTADMKAGILTGLYALAALHAANFDDFAEIAFVLNSDEEVSAPSSQALIEREALGRDAVLVLEAGRENGDIVSSRKGQAQFELWVQGRAAHAGVEPEKGRSATLELAHQIVALQALNAVAPDVTVNVGVIRGGMMANVVAAEACAHIDIRATSLASMEAAVAALRRCALQTTVPDTVVTLEGGIVRPPLEKTTASAQLVRWYQEAAERQGIMVRDAATGGASDGNITAAMGIPTLDGLGPVGGLDHSPAEYITVSSIVPRTMLLAELIQDICTQRT